MTSQYCVIIMSDHHVRNIKMAKKKNTNCFFHRQTLPTNDYTIYAQSMHCTDWV